jgi:cytochrome b
MQKIRVYHATLAILSALSYATGEMGIIHSWLGYGVAVVIALRLLWALSGNPHVGLMRFYPSFEGLNLTNIFTHPSITRMFMLGIALSLLVVTITGIAIDKGKDIGLANAQLIATAFADNDKGKHEENSESFYDEALEEVHELSANLLLLFVGMHIGYLLLFKLPLAKFMLFLNKPNK